MPELKNERHELFCRYYITEIDGESFNGYKAAVKAGYKEPSARQQASRLLTYDNIQARIAELLQESFKRCEIDVDYVLTKLKKIAEDDIKNYLSFGTRDTLLYDEDGEEVQVPHVWMRLKESDEVDTWNISEISIGKDGQFKFKTHCKDNAVVQLGKYLKMFTDKVEHSGSVDINVNTALIDKYLAD